MYSLPTNIETEKELLAILINDSEIAKELIPKIQKDYFYSKNHQQIFRAITKLDFQGIQINIKNLLKYIAKFKKNNITLEEMVEINNLYLTSLYANKFLKILENNYLKRQCMILGKEFISKTKDEELNQNDTIDHFMNNLFILEKVKDKKTDTNEDILSELLNETSHPEEAKKEQIKTGLYELDGIIGGLPIGEITIIGARPAVGKSAFGMFVAKNIGKDKPIGIISLEMSKKQLFKRLVSNYSGINSMYLGRSNLSNTEKNKVAESVSKIAELKFFVDDTPGLNIKSICRKLRLWKREHNIEVALIDYLQYIHSDKNHYNKNDEVTYISRTLKEISKELDISLIALSQLRRPNYENSSKPPVLSDLRDSGSLEQDGALIIFLHTVEEQRGHINNTTLLVRKNRFGGIGNILTVFDKKISDFTELGQDI